MYAALEQQQVRLPAVPRAVYAVGNHESAVWRNLLSRFGPRPSENGHKSIREDLGRRVTALLESAALPSNLPAHASMYSTRFLVPQMPLKNTPARLACDQPLPACAPGVALPAHSPHTACTPREPAAATHVPARRVDHALHVCPTGGWRDVRAPSRLHLPVAAWTRTTSASRPSGPSQPPASKRPSAAANSGLTFTSRVSATSLFDAPR